MGDLKKIILGDILTESKIESIAPNIESRIRVLLNAKGIIKRPVKKETKGATKYFIRKKGQFIYGKQNIHKGAFGVIPDNLDGFESTSDLPAFDVDESCLPAWVDYYLKQDNFYLSLVNIARGAATKRVQPKELFNLKMPLPSIQEQTKLLSHFRSIETGDRELKQELTHQQTLLKKLRQQILQEAIEGKLTADFRAKNPGIEPAGKLLSRIKAEKEQLIKEKKIRKQKPLPPISEEEIPFELPEGWVWCRVREFAILYVDCPHDTPKYQDRGFPCLRAPDITESGLLITTVKRVSKEEYEKRIRRLRPIRNDLVYIREGGRLGIAGLIDTDEHVCLGQRVMMLRFSNESSAKYALRFFNAPMTYDNIVGKIIGSASPHVNVRDIISHVIAVPPLPEQKEIVTKVEKLLALCDQLETQITTNQTHSGQLMQAVLKEAFQQSEAE